MKKLFSALLCLCICVCLSSCTSADDRSDSIGEYDRGWDDGYSLGYYDGYEEGAEYSGDEDSYEDGYEEGYDNGYDDGHSDGYYAGATYTCLFFGDIERAFKCAKNGSSWYTLIDAYDQYEYDIYDDDDKETRSKLFWALVSYTSEDGATKEEYKLLYSAFGSDLYYLDE